MNVRYNIKFYLYNQTITLCFFIKYWFTFLCFNISCWLKKLISVVNDEKLS